MAWWLSHGGGMQTRGHEFEQRASLIFWSLLSIPIFSHVDMSSNINQSKRSNGFLGYGELKMSSSIN